jgi:hypothetical protein
MMMKGVVTSLGLVLALGMAVAASESTKAIVASYLQIHAALSADRIEGVKPAAAAIARDAAKLGTPGEAIVKAAKAMESAADLKAAREALGPLSDAIIAAAAADGWKDLPGLKVGYCSMVDRHWIQKDGKVNNPYYGSEMLTCGELKDPGQASKK